MGSSYTPSAEVQSTTASHNNDNSIVAIWRISFKEFYEEEEESVTEVIGVLYTQETSVVLWSGAKSN